MGFTELRAPGARSPAACRDPAFDMALNTATQVDFQGRPFHGWCRHPDTRMRPNAPRGSCV